jgi:protein phosphatase
VDATNLGRAARRVLLRLASAGGVPAVAIVFDLPVDVILARNAARTARVVDEAVVRDHLAQVRAMIDGPEADLDAEGFSLVAVVREPGELDGLVVVRR